MLKTDEDIPYIQKPWGYEKIWAQTDDYAAKYLYVEAGHKLSRQYHEHKDKTLYVLTGPVILEVGPDSENDEVLSLTLAEGEAYRLQPEAVHRVCAPPDYDIEIIEASTSSPGDIIRLEDAYGRAPDINA